jgi:hypothetical protein
MMLITIRNLIKGHHEYIEVTSEIKSYNEYYFDYLIDRGRILNIALEKRNLSRVDELGMYNCFREEIFVEVFHELKKNGINFKLYILVIMKFVLITIKVLFILINYQDLKLFIQLPGGYHTCSECIQFF